MSASHSANANRNLKIAAVSIAVAVAVLAAKYAAYLVTGSVALYSDAIESIVNVMTAAVALIAIHISRQPPDTHHQFGHTKAEFFAAIFEGAMIIVAAVAILSEAVAAMRSVRVIEQPTLGMAINAAAGAVNGLWAWYLIRTGRESKSVALEADGWHLVTDVVTSAGVLLGLALAVLTGWTILDPLLAAAVAVNILWMAYGIALSSMSSLMDEAASPEIEAQIRAAIQAHGGGALEAHGIRTRQAGPVTFIEFHLVVPGTMTVDAAHEICDRLEEGIEAAIAGSEVVIHVEPHQKAEGGARGTVEI